MPEPDNFTPTEQFQDVNRRIWNKLVREYFRDISTLENNLDLTTPRQALLKACLHKEDDPLLLTTSRMLLFLHGTTWLRDQYPIVAGSLLNEVDSVVTYRPKITLFFREDAQDAEAGYKPAEMEVSFRLINETSLTITNAKLTLIANKIRSGFGTGAGYVFRKGRKLVNYYLVEQGYQFQLYTRELIDAKNLIIKILAINSHTIDSKLLRISQVDDEAEAFPYNPGSQVILGKRKNKPRRRPIVNVRFCCAYATVQNYGKPIYLYSRRSYIPDVLVPT